jgi:site-specific recombinase XerD
MIIEKYKGQMPDNRVLPVADIMTYNKNLNKIAALCGITKKITSHLARHTFATFIKTFYNRLFACGLERREVLMGNG